MDAQLREAIERHILERENYYFAIVWGKNLTKALLSAVDGIMINFNAGRAENDRAKFADVEDVLFELVLDGRLTVIYRPGRGKDGVDRPFEVRTPTQMEQYRERDEAAYWKSGLSPKVLDADDVRRALAV